MRDGNRIPDPDRFQGGKVVSLPMRDGNNAIYG